LLTKLTAPPDLVSAAYTASHPKVNSVFLPSFMRSSNFLLIHSGVAQLQSGVVYDGAIFNASVDMTLLTYDMSSNNNDCFILGDVANLNLGGMFGGVAYIGSRRFCQVVVSYTVAALRSARTFRTGNAGLEHHHVRAGSKLGKASAASKYT